MASPKIADYEKHAAKFGSAMVFETASMNGFTKAELRHLQLRLFDIEKQQPKRRGRRGRR